MAEIKIWDTSDELYDGLCECWLTLSKQAINNHNGFHAALSGGTSPRSLYEKLTKSDFVDRIEWQHNYIYFSDERAVPADHEQSNYLMAKQALFSHVSIPSTQVFRMKAEQQDIEQAAQTYERLLRKQLPALNNTQVQFDLVLLGLGDDGHTASLFPGTNILEEQSKLVAAVYVNKLNSWRMSLTLPAINSAKEIIVIVTGSKKAETVKHILKDNVTDKKPPIYPIQMIKPQGKLTWHLDSAAAEHLLTN